MKKGLKRGLKKIAQRCTRHRHERLSEQETLNAKLRGHYQYYGRSSNFRSLWGFYWGVYKIWRKWLSRRTQGIPLSWEKYKTLLSRHPLLKPQITHTWASTRSPA